VAILLNLVKLYPTVRQWRLQTLWADWCYRAAYSNNYFYFSNIRRNMGQQVG